jgi:hypothetical protein
MTIQPGDVLRATFELTSSGGNTVQNVYYWQHVGANPVSDGDFIDECKDVLLDAYAEIKSDMPSTVAFTRIAFFNVTQDDPIGEEDISGFGTGDGGATSLPLQVASLVTFTTGLRKSLGKKFFGPHVPGNVTGAGLPSAGLLANLADLATILITDLVANGETFVIGHYRYATSTFVRWLTAIVETLYSTWRPRKPGVGA